MASNSSEETLKKKLSEFIKNQDWDKVVEVHKRDKRAFKTKVDSFTGDTAFLQAIFEEKEHAKSLAELINGDESRVPEAKEILGFKNEKCRTALHAAAATGNTEMCIIIATVDKSLVRARDYNGETPLFRAVQYGQKDAFLYLHSLAYDPNDQTFASRRYCWNNDNQTILHNAIIRENFDLAFQIIHWYKELVNVVDKEGDSPLHALARKPAAFASGSSLRGRKRIIYDCLSVEEIKIKEVDKEVENSDREQNEEGNPSNPPENKQTFRNFVRSLCWNAVLGGSHHGKEKSENVDIESGHGHFGNTDSNTTQAGRSFFVEHVSRAIPVILGYGDTSMMKKITEEKEKHVWATQVLDKLVVYSTLFDGKKFVTARQRLNEENRSAKIPREDSEQEFDDNITKSDSNISMQRIGSASTISEIAEKGQSPEKEISKGTAMLVAAKYGVVEIIEKILERFPMAIYDKDEKNKNIVLIALENRHKNILKFLVKKYIAEHIAFQKMDDEGNTALHCAAMYNEESVRPWPVPGAALQMQWEIKWYEFVEKVMPSRLYLRTNKKGQTPKEMFSDTHKNLVKNGGKWLTSTATSCSVVAALIATVAFASSTTAPGGTDSDSKHTIKQNPTFELFAISSLISLCFSVTSLVMFLAILTSRQQEKDFSKELPRKILIGLTSLFVSIASVLVTFCAGHFLIFKDNFKYAVFPVYAVTLLPLCLFAAAQFPLYFDLVLATFWNPHLIDYNR